MIPATSPEKRQQTVFAWDIYALLFLALVGFLIISWGVWMKAIVVPFDGLWVTTAKGQAIVNEVSGPAQGVLQPGDIILEVERQPVEPGWTRYLGKQAGDPVTYHISRQGKFLDATSQLQNPTVSEHFFRLAPLIVAFFFWGIGLYVLAFQPRGFLNRLFFLYCMICCYTLSSGSLSGIQPNPMSHFYISGLCWLGPLAVHLHLHFPSLVIFRRVKFLKIAMYVAAGLLNAAVLLSKLLDESALLRQVIGFLPMIGLLFTFAAVIFLLSRAWWSKRSEGRHQVGIIILGSALGLTPLTMLSILPDMLFDKQIILYHYTLPGLSLIPLAYGYAILRYRLIGLAKYISRTVSKAFVIILLIFLYLLVYACLTQLLPTFEWNDSLWMAILVVGLALIANPLQQQVQVIVDRILYGGWYDYRSVVSSTIEAFNGVESLSQLGDILAEQLVNALHVSGGVLMFLDENEQILDVARVFHWRDIPAQGNLRIDGKLITHLQQLGLPQTSSEIIQALDRAELSPTECTWLDYSQIQLWVPLVYRDRLQGLLLLGTRPGLEPFEPEDRRILGTVAYQAAIAAKNIRLIEALNRRAAEIKHLYSQLLQAREGERKSLARELHDQVIQDLINIHFHLRPNAPLLSPDPQEQANAMCQRVQAVINDLREICTQLRPAALDDLSLGSAMQGYVDDLIATRGLNIQLHLPENDYTITNNLPEEVSITLFRVLQEGLANISRHAAASEVQVTLLVEPDTITLEVRDNGRGFTPPARLGQLIRYRHFGLAGLQERIELVGGALEVCSALGEGTTLWARVPHHSSSS